MKRNHTIKLFFKSLLIVACCTIASPFVARCQVKEVTDNLNIPLNNDADEADTATSAACCASPKNSWGSLAYADFGGSSVMSKINGKTSTANGLAWALGAQLAYAMQKGCTKTVFSAGLEIRNYNATASSTDRFGGTAYDNLHYWYVGIPVQVQLMTANCCPKGKVSNGYYAQAGFTTGFTANINDVSSRQGVTTKYDTTGHYKKYMLQPYLSAGFTCTTPRATYQLGPYVGYTLNSLVPNSSVSQHILSYGLKFTTMFF